MLRLLIIVVLTSSGILHAYTSYVPYTVLLGKGGSEIRYEYDYFATSSRFDTDGAAVPLVGDESYNHTDQYFIGSYGMAENFDLIGDFRLRVINSTEIDPTDSDQSISLTASGLESGSLGFKYAWKMEDQMQFALEGAYRYKFYTNPYYDEDDRDFVAFGDDGNEYQAGLSAIYATRSNNYLQFKGLYRIPGDYQSPEVLSNVELALVWKKFSLYGGFEYLYSLGQDEYTSNPEEKPQLGQGPTAMYNSTNRTWMAPYGGFSFTMGKKWRLMVGAKSIISGTSTDEAMHYLVTLATRSGNSKKFKKYVQKFKSYRVEAHVVKVSPKKKYIIIDAGVGNGMRKNMKCDFYHFDYLGGNKLIANGFAIKPGASKSIVHLSSSFSKRRVKDGTVVRCGIIKN